MCASSAVSSAPMALLRLVLLVVLLAACGNAVSSGTPTDVPPEEGTCAAIAGGGCACGAASGVWRCVGESPVCVCATPDAASDVELEASIPEDTSGPDPAVCLGPCTVNADCERACRASASDTAAYCCVENRCVAARAACPAPGVDARVCTAGAWGPVCSRTADCTLLCGGSSWFCVRPASSGLPRCELTADAGR